MLSKINARDANKMPHVRGQLWLQYRVFHNREEAEWF